MAKEVRVFLNLFVESKELEGVTQRLVKLPELTDVYEVTGEYDIVCMLKVENILAFRPSSRIRFSRSTASKARSHQSSSTSTSAKERRSQNSVWWDYFLLVCFLNWSQVRYR